MPELSDAACACLDAVAACGRECATLAELEAAGHAADAVAELRDAGYIETWESVEGVPLPSGRLATFTPWGAAAWGVRLEEFDDEQPRWVPALAPGPRALRLRRRGAVDITRVDARLSALIHRRRAERLKDEERRRALLRERAGLMIDPHTGQVVNLWGVSVSRRVQRVGTARRRDE